MQQVTCKLAWDHRSQANTNLTKKIATEMKKVPDIMGAGPLVLGGDRDKGSQLSGSEKIK